jgi:hypothetical protein
MAWRTRALRGIVGEFERQGNTTFVWGPLPRAPTSTCGLRLSRRQKLLVRAGSQRQKLLVRTSSQKRGGEVVRGEAETTRANRQQVGDGASCR